MEKLKSILEEHLTNLRLQINNSPKPNDNDGILSEIINNLSDIGNKTSIAKEFVDLAMDDMINYTNENLIDNYPREELVEFLNNAKQQLNEVGMEEITKNNPLV